MREREWVACQRRDAKKGLCARTPRVYIPKAILKANDVFAYNPNSRKTFEKEFRAYEFDLKTPFAPAETKRHGILIFETAKKEPVASPKELTLTIEGLAQPVSLKLN